MNKNLVMKPSTLISLATLILGFYVVAIKTADSADSSDDEILSRVKRWEEFPNVTFTFDCTDRAIGFYADLEFDCMIFHMCDERGRRIPYMCGKGTAFNQKFRVCDWDFNVDCENAPEWYYLNDLTYEKPPPEEEYYYYEDEDEKV